MAIYLDILTPLYRLSLPFQKDQHDPVQEFTWTMEKLKLRTENTHDSQDNVMTSYKKFLNEIIEKEKKMRKSWIISVGYSEKDIQDIQDIRKKPNTNRYLACLLHQTLFYGN